MEKGTKKEKKESKLSNRKVAIISFIVTICVFVALIGISKYGLSNSEESKTVTEEVWNKPYDRNYANMMKTWPDCPDKKDRGYLPRQVFCELPNMPQDFERVKNEYKLKRLELYEVKSDYWKQPEWIPTFNSIILPLLQNPDFDRFGVTPFPGSYPSEFVLEGDMTREPLRFDFLVFSPTSITYSGVKVIPLWSNNAELQLNKFSDRTNKINQDASDIQQYFDIEISPDVFLLEPTIPIYNDDWIYKVKVLITAKPNLPKGKYALAITYVSPDVGLPNHCNKKYLLNDYGELKSPSEIPKECKTGLQNIIWHREYLNLYNSLQYPRMGYVKFFLWQK